MNDPNNGDAHMNEPTTPAPTLEGINRERLQQLDAEVAEWNRRRAGAAKQAATPTAPAEEADRTLSDIGGELGAALRSLRAKMLAKPRQDSEPEPPKAEQNGQMVLFPQWADNRRAAVHAVFRSALFPALNFKEGRPFLKEKRIASVEGLTVFFTGEQFDQSDLDVYLELLDIAHVSPFGAECAFSAYGLLKALGRAKGQANHKWLHSVLIRLRSGTVDMTDHRVRYFGGLIEGGIKDEISKHYIIMINPAFARFFRSGMWSSLDLDQRRALGRNQTAKALHAYYSTHAAPGPHTYGKLAEIVGLNGKNRRDVKANIIKAHDELKRVGFLAEHEAGADTIKTTVNHTPSQARHIVRKMIKSRRLSRAKGTV